MARTSIKVTVRFAHLIYPYAVPAVLSVCQNQRTPKVMHKSWSLTRHINDVFQLCTDLTDLYSHAFAPENLSCISLSIVHRHPHMPETTKSILSIETQQVGGPQRSRDQGVFISAPPGPIQASALEIQAKTSKISLRKTLNSRNSRTVALSPKLTSFGPPKLTTAVPNLILQDKFHQAGAAICK